MAFTGYSVAAFRKGNRVQLQPYMDAWMQGDRYGEVTRVTKHKVHVRLDKSGRIGKFLPYNLLEIL